MFPRGRNRVDALRPRTSLSTLVHGQGKRAKLYGRSIDPLHHIGELLVLLAALLKVGGEFLMVVRVKRLIAAFEALNCTLVDVWQITETQ
jgi:hypothetical protein